MAFKDDLSSDDDIDGKAKAMKMKMTMILHATNKTIYAIRHISL